ncbi:hypothetical protein BGZ57DRAFT_284626 [Hyaloscypha finlandica]|nr:hypothetical protein BGZ57DRAFT_284626 [Hyaloscypha finlandica]
MTSRIFDADEYFGDPESQNVSIDPRGFRRLSGDERTRLIDVTGVIKGIDLGKQGAYGVFFAKGSSFNRCGLLPKDGPINDQASELYAAIMALKTVQENSLAADINLLVLRVTSNYLPQHMDGVIWKWEDQDYVNSKGSRVVHADLFHELHTLFVALEKQATDVKLWRVTKKENKLAEDVARSAFNL